MFNTISDRAFAELQLGAGMLLKSFDPSNPTTPTDANIICATTGGINISVVPRISDLGTDIDNCPEGTMDLQRIDGWDVQISTTALAVSPEFIKLALGAADYTLATKRVAPRSLGLGDFQSQLWWVGEVGVGGFAAVKLTNALSTGGFVLQTEKNGKGKVSVTIKAHTSLSAPSTPPCEFYATGGAGIVINSDPDIVIEVGDEVELTATTYPTGQTVSWSSSNSTVASVSSGTVTGLAEGFTRIHASMTYSGTTYDAKVIVLVVAATT